jgi:hypothetical protein
MLLPFKAMLLSERARGRKSGSPPLFAPSFKVQGYKAHNRNSGFAVLPQCYGLNARGALKVRHLARLRPGHPAGPPMRRCRRLAPTPSPPAKPATSGLRRQSNVWRGRGSN